MYLLLVSLCSYNRYFNIELRFVTGEVEAIVDFGSLDGKSVLNF